MYWRVFQNGERPSIGGERARDRRITLLALILFFLGSAITSFGGVHPVQLDNNADTDTCVQCHENKTKGADIHPAVSMGCLTCHVIRNTKDTTRVNLKNAKPATLCFQCHADKQVKENVRGVHPPALEDCLKCHDPHSSPNEKLLLKPTMGDKKENLCLECHRQGVDVPKDGSRHPALDMGCQTCHVTHKVGTTGDQEYKFHLIKPAPELCLGCHDVSDPQLVKAHQSQPFEKVACTNCHNPHDSVLPKLMQKYVHPPFADRSCDTCHVPAKDGKVVLTQSDSRALCAMCHDEQVKQIDTAKVAHPGAQGECIACHSPHASRSPRLLKPDPVAVCLTCHSDLAEMQQTQKVLHDPAFKQACSVCHVAHGNDREHLLRADVNQLCLTCHGPNAKGTPVPDSTDVTIFNGAVRLPGDYFKKVSLLPLDAQGRGHPQQGHPVGGVLDPSDPQKTKTITCVRCHSPHGGSKAMLVTGQEGSESLCSQCHANLRRTIVPVPQAPATTREGKKKRK
jgi:predicted CXXCH cytochrome family protein